MKLSSCSLVPKRPETGTGLWLRGKGLLFNKTKIRKAELKDDCRGFKKGPAATDPNQRRSKPEVPSRGKGGQPPISRMRCPPDTALRGSRLSRAQQSIFPGTAFEHLCESAAAGGLERLAQGCVCPKAGHLSYRPPLCAPKEPPHGWPFLDPEQVKKGRGQRGLQEL